MPTNAHELPLEMVRNRPELVPEILRGFFDYDVAGDCRVTLASESYAVTNPAELRCDATVLLGDPDTPDLGVVVESQLRVREEKTYSWPAYLAALRLRRKCPVTLLVLCPDRATADGCAEPIDMGHPGWVLEPLTLAPEDVGPITDPNVARGMPELTVLSAPAHADGPEAKAVVNGVLAALATFSGDTRDLYDDHVRSRFSDVARKLLEESMKLKNYEWQSEWHRSRVAQGKAESILAVLEARGLPVSDDVRDRVTGCADPDQVGQWVRRAAVVDKAEEIFD